LPLYTGNENIRITGGCPITQAGSQEAVLLDLVEESATPEWATKYDDEEEEREAKFRKMNEQARAILQESRLPPDQRAAAFRQRAQRQHEDWVAGLNATRRRDEQRAETRMMEALQSPKWGNKLIARKVLPWKRVRLG
jgi:endo-alpha-1,4-polygalactosaminidase (GH114 family)